MDVINLIPLSVRRLISGYVAEACHLPCPLDCKLSDWSAWSGCSAPCGSGLQMRSKWLREKAFNGGRPCPRLDFKNQVSRAPGHLRRAGASPSFCYLIQQPLFHTIIRSVALSKETSAVVPGVTYVSVSRETDYSPFPGGGAPTRVIRPGVRRRVAICQRKSCGAHAKKKNFPGFLSPCPGAERRRLCIGRCLLTFP